HRLAIMRHGLAPVDSAVAKRYGLRNRSAISFRRDLSLRPNMSLPSGDRTAGIDDCRQGGGGDHLEFDAVKQRVAVPALEGPEAGDQFLRGIEAEEGQRVARVADAAGPDLGRGAARAHDAGLGPVRRGEAGCAHDTDAEGKADGGGDDLAVRPVEG